MVTCVRFGLEIREHFLRGGGAIFWCVDFLMASAICSGGAADFLVSALQVLFIVLMTSLIQSAEPIDFDGQLHH
jgi:hypothetical protein